MRRASNVLAMLAGDFVGVLCCVYGVFNWPGFVGKKPGLFEPFFAPAPWIGIFLALSVLAILIAYSVVILIEKTLRIARLTLNWQYFILGFFFALSCISIGWGANKTWLHTNRFLGFIIIPTGIFIVFYMTLMIIGTTGARTAQDDEQQQDIR